VEGGTTIVTQTRVKPGEETAFTDWQAGTSAVVAGFPGFVRQSVMPPAPPEQVDWVILQSFQDREKAVAWLQSDARQQRLAGVAKLLAGFDDVHVISDDSSGVLPAPVSVVISTRIKPGQEAAYRRWEQRIAAAQSQAPGFQGYRLEPPIPGVQADWVAILRFDTDANLQVWMNAPVRQRLLQEAAGFTEAFHSRTVKTGFDQWFRLAANDTPGVAVWQQNMLVLLMLYPVVFLFGLWVQTPLLMGRLGLSFPVALFIGNVVSVLLLNFLVPWVSGRFEWWLRPAKAATARARIAGTLVVIGLYGLMLVIFGLA
jgi:antibiotic biosynthesis monooxygenase (ABM) superfamily enzyme